MLSEMMSELVTERRASLIDGLVHQGAKVEELAFFFNTTASEMSELLDLECIDIVHRMKPLTQEEKEGLAETRSEFIENLRQETWDDEALSCMFNTEDIESLVYLSDWAAVEDFQRYMEAERKKG